MDKPVLSHELMAKKVFPHLEEDRPLFFIVIDNLRYDQWKVIEPIVLEHFNVEEESAAYSILPTTTAYSRNAIFSGMLPTDMVKYHSDIWVGEDQDDGKNIHEFEFLKRQLKKKKLDIKASYHKITQTHQGRQLVDSFNNLLNNPLNVIVYNFVDMLSHARTDLQMIRELAPSRIGLPFAYPFVAPAFAPAGVIQADLARKCQGHYRHRPRYDSRKAPGQDRGRPQYQYQPALQTGPEPELRQQQEFSRSRTPRICSCPK